RQLQRMVAVGGEIRPRPLDQFARHVRHHAADDVLRAVARTGIGNRPRLDVRTHRTQTALDHVRLVLDDHGQADAHAITFRQLRYFTGIPALAPASASSRNKSSPPEPADRIMPSDTPKRILRGARLAINTTLRPTSFSGS